MVTAPHPRRLTPRAVIYLGGHEAIVLEWYLDSEGVATWALGVTNASGHNVDRYKDKPQTLRKCLEVSIWLMETKYMPDVLKAFAGHDLSEAQLTAALSFHYNTGRILRTDWVSLFKAGKLRDARRFLETHYLNDGDLTARRKSEAALFFEGAWPAPSKTTIWPVKKPSYRPDWSKPSRVDITADVAAILGAAS